MSKTFGYAYAATNDEARAMARLLVEHGADTVYLDRPDTKRRERTRLFEPTKASDGQKGLVIRPGDTLLVLEKKHLGNGATVKQLLGALGVYGGKLEVAAIPEKVRRSPGAPKLMEGVDAETMREVRDIWHSFQPRPQAQQRIQRKLGKLVSMTTLYRNLGKPGHPIAETPAE